jgi:predicted dehydrogenase
MIKSIEEKLGDSPMPFSTLTEALADDELFDAVLIMAPTFDHLHEKLAVEALASKKHTLLEKPIEITIEGTQKIMQAYKQARIETPNLIFTVAENAGYWPEIVQAKKMMEAGAIGDVVTCHAKFWESAMGPWAGDYLPGTWRCDESNLPAASFTFDGATHWIRPLRMWFGTVTKVVAVTGKSLAHMAGASFSHALLKFESGSSASFETLLAPSAISDQPFFRIQGTKGELVIDGFEGGLHHYHANEHEETVCTTICKEGWDAGYADEQLDFARAVRGEKALDMTADEAVEDMRVLLAIFRSAESENWVAP